ncbi:DUF1194 domain-containing protein [Roseomonas marmotae]|uniref:DUF1194 domain-containing protein n=1 Tax=Roseomonas marmotae TaxID=2768161 RepID=A0ABS3KHA1_9PROT|nr:DUF1194 domain-containing protein [Roseomonas marmotae]MBO1075993.1 DUF1194 domain-containing protein [Roseomonas marmotae]QTI80126.1 DUF1194 domain-containing protein [Roseomonas marmotae]
MRAVDLALCLAVDVSASVDFDEFGLMVGGLAEAFRQERIIQAATAGPRGAIAVSVLFWSARQEVAVPWMRIADAAAAHALADALDASPRLPPPGATALGLGMAAGLALLGGLEAEAERMVLDVSGDGRHNQGPAPGAVRDLGVNAGVTLNGLAVLNEEPELLAHYEAEVIGGPAAFAISCADYADFAEAIQRKLFREIRGGMVA